MIKRQTITLDIPFDDDLELPPHLWEWKDLLGVTHDVVIVSHSDPRDAEEGDDD